MAQAQGTPGKRLTILSIDGGGVRGVIPAVCLEFLEKQLQALDGPEARIADYFDVVAGTSTGGLIAAMLTAPDEKKRPKMTTTQIKQFYLEKASIIFPKPGWSIWGVSALFGGPKYSAAPLKQILVDEFSDLKIADCVTDVLITSFDGKTQQPVFFDKQVALRNSTFNAKLQDVCLGSAAAPTYFPAHQFELPYPEGGAKATVQYNLVDGGVAANNPAEVAIVHAVKDLCLGDSPHKSRITEFKGYRDLLVLSLGTGARTISYEAKEMAAWSQLDWVTKTGQPIIQMLSNSSAYLVDYDISIQFQIEKVKENYLRMETGEIDEKTATIDDASKENLQALVNVANSLLEKKPKYRDAMSGQLLGMPNFQSNRDALTRWAQWLSEEKKARAQNRA